MKQLFFLLALLALNLTAIAADTLTITSPSFDHNDTIPLKYTCEGPNVNPELNIEGIPSRAKSLAIIVEDPDAPMGTVDHWIIWNILPTDKIEENSAPGVQGKNVKKENAYTGPCPPTGTHRYYFKVYALDKLVQLRPGADKKLLEAAMKGHIVAKGELIGLYKKTMTKNMGTK